MSDTQHHVDIDLTALPAQRAAEHDVLEIIHRPDPPAAATASPARLALIIAAAVAITFAVLIPLGLVISAPASTPVPLRPTTGNGDISRLLLEPLSSRQPAQPAYPTDQQQLIQSMLTP
jgi:hypothetical protein